MGGDMSDLIENIDTEEQDTGLPDNKTTDELDDETVVKRIKRLREQANDAQSRWRREARTDFAFLAGDQWTTEEISKLEEAVRVPVVFNRVEPTIQSISGHEINNRQTVKYLPRQAAQDSAVAELLTNAADWCRDQCNAEDEESDSFIDMLACGIGVTYTHLDYTENPDGMIVIDRVDPLSVRWDPSARKRNLVDRTWNSLDLKMTLADIKREWPDKADELTADNLDAAAEELDDDEPHNANEAPFYRRDQKEKNAAKSQCTVVMHEWFEEVPFWRALDPMTNQITELDEEGLKRMEQAVAAGMAMQPSSLVKQKRRVYRVAYVCGSVLLEERESVTQKGFLVQFITGRRDRNRNEWYGVVRSMRDPQRFANKYLSQLEAINRSNGKGGLLVEEDAVDNIRKLEEKWSQIDSIITLNPGAISQGKIQPKPVNQLPSTPEKLLEFSISSIRDVTGVNLEALGLADRDQPGIVEAQRRESAMTILAPLFNSLRHYRKEQGRVMADLIVKYIADNRLIRIVQGDGTESSIPLLKMPETMEFDVVVDAASNAPDQKMRTFAVLGQLLPGMQQAGIPVPPSIIDYTPLPQALVNDWKKFIAQKQSQPPPPHPDVQKAQMQIQADMQKAQMKDQFERWRIQQEAALKQYEITTKAQVDAQAEQLRAAIDEQSQIINAQANESKAASDAIRVRLDGLAKLVDTISKVRASAEKAIEKGTRGPSVIALPMGDNGMAEMQTAAVQQMAQAVQSLQAAIQAPKPPMRVIRDANGNIQGVQ